MPDGSERVLRTENVAADDPQRPKGLTLTADAVRIRSRDPGHGMSAEIPARTTEPFFTAELRRC
jgi:signal transduction histidine kinase